MYFIAIFGIICSTNIQFFKRELLTSTFLGKLMGPSHPALGRDLGCIPAWWCGKIALSEFFGPRISMDFLDFPWTLKAWDVFGVFGQKTPIPIGGLRCFVCVF